MKTKKLLSLILTVVMLVSMICQTGISVLADGVYWDLTNGVLTISGSGSMDPLCYSGTSPWYSQRLKVKSIIIEEGITDIGYKAFMSCVNATSVSIPSTVTKIKDYAFDSCFDIEELNLPAGLKSIGDYAFTYCDSVTKLTLPDGLESIGKGVFSNMTITDLVIPESVTFIDDYAMRYCTKLESVTLPSHMTEFPEQLFAFCDSLTTVELPAGLTSLGVQCFYRSYGLTHITLPAGITEIPEYTFYDCSNLAEISFEGDITSIGRGAFESTNSLTSFDFQDTITEIGTRAFAGSGISGELTLPAGLTTVIDHTFRECTSITSLNIPAALESIGYEAFYGCCGLESLTIPSTVKSIDYQAFYCCCGIEGALVIPEGVTALGYQAFGDCDSLTSVSIPLSLTQCEGSPFAYSDHIKQIILPEGMTELPYELFAYLNGLKDIELPDTLNSLGYCAFFGNEGLTSITIPASVSVIPSQCFYGCVNLEKVTVLGTIVRIEDSAFCDTRSLRNFDFEPGLTYIGDYAFTRSALNGDIVIPEGVEYVGDYAFWNSDIESITLPSTVEYVSNLTFWETNLEYINVHEDNQHYASLDGVLYTEDMKELIMYNNRSDRVEFHIPATVEKVDEYCFYGGEYGDAKLKRIIFPRSINELPGYLFYNFSPDRVFVYKDSYAEEYFRNWDIDYLYVVDKIELLTPPSRLVYPIGGKFSTAGMTVSFEDSEGYTGIIDSGFDIGEYDFSTPGQHSVPVGYNGKWINILVTVDPDLVLLPASEHPYPDEFYGEWEYTDKYNFESLDVTFAPETETESYYDTITIYDKDGNEVGVYSGTELAGVTVNVPGNYFRIVLQSDYSYSLWGFEVVSVTGNCEHIPGEWTVTKEPTTEAVGEEAILCTKCGKALETREIPKLEPVIGPEITGVFNYTVSMVNVEDVKEIRFAIGHYTTGSEVKAAEKNVTLDAATVAKNVDDWGTFKYDLPWVGEYTFWVRTNDGASYFLYTNVNYIVPYADTYGVMLTVKDYGENYKDMWIAKGNFNTYNEIKASNDFKYQASKNKLDLYAKTTHDFSYTLYEPGDYTILIRYNDGTNDVLHTTLTVDEPVFTPNGLQITVSNIPDIKIIRTAYGHYESVADIKKATGVRNFSNKTDIKNAEEYMIQYRDEGEVTLIVEYNNGYKHFYYYKIEQKVATMTQNGNTVTFGNLDGLYNIRYAKGEYTTSSQIKKAPGSKVIKPDAIADGRINVTLDPGTYTFCVQFDDESYNYYSVTVE